MIELPENTRKCFQRTRLIFPHKTNYPPFRIATLHKKTRKKYRYYWYFAAKYRLYQYQVFLILAITSWCWWHICKTCRHILTVLPFLVHKIFLFQMLWQYLWLDYECKIVKNTYATILRKTWKTCGGILEHSCFSLSSALRFKLRNKYLSLKWKMVFSKIIIPRGEGGYVAGNNG